MTDDIPESDSQDSAEDLDDVSAALESTGMVDPEGDESGADGDESEEGGLPGPLQVFEQLSGSGKSLDSYEGSPIAEALGPEESKGALHIARGIDGLSPLGATHPLADIAVGVLLLKMESDGKLTESDESGDFETEKDPARPGEEDRFDLS